MGPIISIQKVIHLIVKDYKICISGMDPSGRGGERPAYKFFLALFKINQSGLSNKISVFIIIDECMIKLDISNFNKPFVYV